MENKPMVDRQWSTKGINKVQDMLDDDQKILSHPQLSRKFGEITQMSYNTVIAAMPREWKKLLKNNEINNTNTCNTEFSYDKYAHCNKKVNIFYRILTQNAHVLDLKAQMLSNLLQTNINTEQLIKLIKCINATTICVKLRSFQYKMFMSAITTNIQLYRFKIKDSNLCSFCREKSETVDHLFFDCKNIMIIWQHLATRIRLDNITLKNVICNRVNSNPKNAKNTIVLIVKFCIYKTRCANERISYKTCENYILEYVNIEEQIAKSKNKLNLHELKWYNII